MDVTPLITKGRLSITGYGNGGFKLNGEFIPGSILLFPERQIEWNNPSLESWPDEMIGAIKQSGVELILLGTGQRMAQAGNALNMALRSQGIALECMDTGAACRTYNVLMSEERKVAAALIAV